MSVIVRKANGNRSEYKDLNPQVLTFKHEPTRFLNLAVFKTVRPSVPNRTSIRQIFFDVNLVNHHKGLEALARKKGINLEEMQPGDFLVFVNSLGNYAKILGANVNTGGPHLMLPITSIKAPRGRISPLILQNLPKIFNGQPFDYDATLKPILEAHLAQRARRRRIKDTMELAKS